MDFIGSDLHKTSSQVCILSEDGELTERRIKSTRESFEEVFAARPPARILVAAAWALLEVAELSERGALRLGDEDRRPAQQGESVRGAGAEAGPDTLRHVEGRDRVRPAGPEP
jgi:hypothetical protein